MAISKLPQFNSQELLEQILDAGKKLAKDGKKFAADGKLNSAELTKRGKKIAVRGEDALMDKLGIEDTVASREALRKGVGTGAAAGALALLLTSRSARKMATLGGLAGLGALAYRAHQSGQMPKTMDDAISLIPKNMDDVIGLIKGPRGDARAEILLQAMVAAAKADGTLSAAEIKMIKAHNPDSVDALEAALAQTPDAKSIAALAKTDQQGAEIYAVSCRVANGLNAKERDYLDQLAMALRLDPVVAAKLETDVRTG